MAGWVSGLVVDRLNDALQARSNTQNGIKNEDDLPLKDNGSTLRVPASTEGRQLHVVKVGLLSCSSLLLLAVLCCSLLYFFTYSSRQLDELD